MRLPVFLLFLVAFVASANSAFAQHGRLFQPYDCRYQAELLNEASVTDTLSAAAIAALLDFPENPVIEIDTVNGWQHWTTVNNFEFGKDRGDLQMITEIDALNPFFRDKIYTLMSLCRDNGLDVRVVESYRTHAKQNEYQTMGKKYTRSGAGKSKHQYGLAIDVVPFVDGVAVWDNTALWKKIGLAGESLGLRWGGRWKRPYDPGHFEWTGGLTTTQLASGSLPPFAADQYPCIAHDMRQLRRYWNEWETSQAAMTRK